jgi:hypothetical protein
MKLLQGLRCVPPERSASTAAFPWHWNAGIAVFEHLNDRSWLIFAVFNLRQCLMERWVELSPKRRHLLNIESFECRRQQPLRGKNEI